MARRAFPRAVPDAATLAILELQESLARNGNIACPECSSPSFTIWHKPGEHVKDAASRSEQATRRAQ